MIQLILFDVGETLLHDGVPFPHVVQALAIIAKIKTATGSTLAMGVISDFGSTALGTNELERKNAEDEFVQILKAGNIESFFRPFERCVTISARAGVFKPDRRIFELALQRSGTNAGFSDCLFVTENRAHLLAARGFGCEVLEFGENALGVRSFSDWSEAPTLIAELVDPDNLRNRELAFSLILGERYEVEGFKCLNRAGRVFNGQAGRLCRIDRSDLGNLSGAFISIPVDVSIRCTAKGTIDRVVVKDPSDDDVDDAISYVQQLARRGQIGESTQAASRNVTHVISKDDQGRRVIARCRFSNHATGGEQ